MTDRERLRKLAQGWARFAAVTCDADPCDVAEAYALGFGMDAINAIALWTLLREPTCMLCGEERQYRKLMTPDSEYQYFIAGPDAGSVLCSKCREGK